MKLSRTAKFFIALGAEILILLIVIILKVSILAGGTEVFLRLAPVDPRDPLRGDYMTISYDISTLNSYSFQNQDIKNGDIVYVPLYKSGRFWSAGAGISKTRPETSGQKADFNETVYIKGAVTSGGSGGSGFANSDGLFVPGQNITVSYNIESYFIPEGKGREWPQSSLCGQPRSRETGFFTSPLLARCDNAFAQVMVDENGNAVLKKIYVNDKPWP